MDWSRSSVDWFRSSVDCARFTFGLVEERQRRPRTAVSTQRLGAATAPNIVGSADFTGQFRVEGRSCSPLTFRDNLSRALLAVDGVDDERDPTASFTILHKRFIAGAMRQTPFAQSSIDTLSALALAAFASVAIAVTACGGTDVGACPTGGTPTIHDHELIAKDAIWTAASGPHIVEGSVRLAEGVKLTIEPCVTVRMRKDAVLEVGDASHKAASKLVAHGAAETPILFTKDGDSRWGFALVQYPATAELSHVTFEGGGSEQPNGGHASLIVRGDDALPFKPMVDVVDVTIRDSEGPGIWVRESGGFTASSDALEVTKAGNANATDRVRFPVVIHPTALTTLPKGAYTGNAVDEILIDVTDVAGMMSGMLEDATVRDRGVPYRVGAVAGSTWTVDDTPEHPKTTLTIEAGVTLRFPANDGTDGARLQVHASTTDMPPSGSVLRVLGTDEKAVLITSAESSPKPSDWVGIYFGGGAHAETTIEHAIIEYAGFDSSTDGFTCPADHSNDGAIIIAGGAPKARFLSDSAVRHSAAAGVMRGWGVEQGPAIDFTETNTFDDIAECVQTNITSQTDPCPAGCK